MSTAPATAPSRGALLRFRVMAYLTGTMLLVLVFYAMPMKYFADNDGPVAVVGAVHGWLYVLYLVTIFQIAYQMRWSLVRGLLVASTGIVPFAAFVAERRLIRSLSARPSQDPQPTPVP